MVEISKSILSKAKDLKEDIRRRERIKGYPSLLGASWSLLYPFQHAVEIAPTESDLSMLSISDPKTRPWDWSYFPQTIVEFKTPDSCDPVNYTLATHPIYGVNYYTLPHKAKSFLMALDPQNGVHHEFGGPSIPVTSYTIQADYLKRVAEDIRNDIDQLDVEAMRVLFEARDGSSRSLAGMLDVLYLGLDLPSQRTFQLLSCLSRASTSHISIPLLDGIHEDFATNPQTLRAFKKIKIQQSSLAAEILSLWTNPIEVRKRAEMLIMNHKTLVLEITEALIAYRNKFVLGPTDTPQDEKLTAESLYNSKTLIDIFGQIANRFPPEGFELFCEFMSRKFDGNPASREVSSLFDVGTYDLDSGTQASRVISDLIPDIEMLNLTMQPLFVPRHLILDESLTDRIVNECILHNDSLLNWITFKQPYDINGNPFSPNTRCVVCAKTDVPPQMFKHVFGSIEYQEETLRNCENYDAILRDKSSPIGCIFPEFKASLEPSPLVFPRFRELMATFPQPDIFTSLGEKGWTPESHSAFISNYSTSWSSEPPF